MRHLNSQAIRIWNVKISKVLYLLWIRYILMYWFFVFGRHHHICFVSACLISSPIDTSIVVEGNEGIFFFHSYYFFRYFYFIVLVNIFLNLTFFPISFFFLKTLLCKPWVFLLLLNVEDLLSPICLPTPIQLLQLPPRILIPTPPLNPLKKTLVMKKSMSPERNYD